MTQPQLQQMKPGIYHFGNINVTCPGCSREVNQYISVRFPDELAFGCKDCRTPLFRVFIDYATGSYDYEFFS